MKYLYAFLPLLLASCSSQDVKQCVDIQSCGAHIHNNIQSHLVISNADIGKTVTLRFLLNDDTEIIKTEIIESSGDERFDYSVINAVNKSFPDEQLLELSSADYEKVRKVKLTVSPR
ncbi:MULTISPECIES: cell envelope integrity protein TolA [Photobacterium]|uniref:Uncharacterized protein n=1 Tax=Photobacterium alginatilyticum TaxID=1775171 RepID=A0ABW9YHD3_9GAMM|nr:cell envelope integrity protein TolA [Photobacterium alginatilyticum]NBI53217.1 hypothetical protein [Photobacterium alginatilyticum]